MNAVCALPQTSLRKPMVALWRFLWALVAFAAIYPIQFGTLRLTLVVGLLGLWIGALLLYSNRKWVLSACLALAVLAAAFLFLPGRSGDPAALRREYVRSLLPYEDTLYLWGGENRVGIDCSGLVRRGLIDAELKQGLLTANPKLLREGAFLWWQDCTARELKDGYRGKTRFLLAAPSLNELDHTRLLPGDFAVTENGVHTLAYLGDQTWIEADPLPLRVIRVKVPAQHNGWFDEPVHILRWRQFE